jgi:uncharacterized membrane protein
VIQLDTGDYISFLHLQRKDLYESIASNQRRGVTNDLCIMGIMDFLPLSTEFSRLDFSPCNCFLFGTIDSFLCVTCRSS